MKFERGKTVSDKLCTLAGALAIVLLAVSGCIRAQARTAPELPPLDVPAPPPRQIEPRIVEAPPLVPLADEPARITPVRPATPPPRPDPARAETARPEVAADAAKPVEEPPKAAPVELKTMPADKASDFERAIRAQISGAIARLSRVDYQQLSADRKATYNEAKSFVSQAEEALKVKNLPFASTVADKAVTLATQLIGR